MMTDTYSLPGRKARICRIAGAAFLFLAACSGLSAVSTGVVPGPAFDCSNGPCAWSVQPTRLLDDEQRAAVAATRGAGRRFEDYVAKPVVRLGLVGTALIRSGPFAMLLLGVGLALRRLGASAGDPLADALPWLRFASLAAIISAIADPLGASLTGSLLSHGTPEGPHWIIALDFNAIGVALMLAVAAYATIWALEAGVRAQRDLAEIV